MDYHDAFKVPKLADLQAASCCGGDASGCQSGAKLNVCQLEEMEFEEDFVLNTRIAVPGEDGSRKSRTKWTKAG